MYSFFQFIKFFFAAKTKYKVHSPFVFKFIEQVLEDTREFYAFDQIEAVRKLLLQNKKIINVSDFGAGSVKLKAPQRKIKAIAKSALSSPLFCRILFRTVNYYKPKTILEIGTSLGISSLYQHLLST